MCLSGLSTALVLAFCVGSASADGMPDCATPVLVTDLLARSECDSQDGITRSRFLGAAPSSPYATEFDRRSVAVARGHDPKAVSEAAGVILLSRGARLQRTRLTRPPAEDQIARRTAVRATSKYRQWTVMMERVQYSAQGGAPGFVVDCATALSSTARETTAVAECFALEDRQRFLRTLDEIR
jgi:hypothetical protein